MSAWILLVVCLGFIVWPFWRGKNGVAHSDVGFYPPLRRVAHSDVGSYPPVRRERK